MKRTLVVLSMGGLLAAGAAAPALGGAAHPAHASHPSAAKVFRSSVKPNKNVKPGTTLKLTSSHAKRSTAYSCVLIVIKGSTYGADTSTIKPAQSNRHGHVTCTQKYQPYTTNYGKTLHCPPTRSERRKGYSCAVSLADSATQGQKSASVAKFTAKK